MISAGSTAEPADIRFIIEQDEDDRVRDSFSIICRAIRTDNGVKVIIPRLINLLQRGAHRARLEVVLESRLFVPLQEEVYIEEPIVVEVKKPETKVVESEELDLEGPKVTVNTDGLTTLNNLLTTPTEVEEPEEEVVTEEIIEKPEEVEVTPTSVKKPLKISVFDDRPSSTDEEWKESGFKGFKNPFKNS